MDDLLPRLSGPEPRAELGGGFASGALLVDADGFPSRWDSLCADRIFGQRLGGFDDDDFKLRTEPKSGAGDAKESGNANELRQPESATSGDSHGATNSQAAGMSLRSGHVKSHASVSHDEAASDSDGEQQPCTSLPQKRRRRRTADAEDYVYSQHSDPEEKKLEKRRAKNRRTARASRERKQAELQQMKSDLAARTEEVKRLHDVIAEKDRQIAQLAVASSPDRGARPPFGGESTKRGVSESAVLSALIYLVTCVHTKRTAPLKTPSPRCLTTFSATSPTGDDVPALRTRLRALFRELPRDEQQPVYDKMRAALGRNGRAEAARDQLEEWLTTPEGSGESGQ